MAILQHKGNGPQKLRYKKDPDSVMDFRVIWGSWLQSGESISSRSWESDGIYTVDSNSNESTETINGTVYSNIEIVWLSGGTAGSVGTVTNQIVTSAGRTVERSIEIECLEQ
jgi:hypothetical protein